MTSWKVGSRWHANGDKKNSVLDVFLYNSIVFVKERNTNGHFLNEVKIGDIIAIADGLKIVASGVVVSNPCYLRHLSLSLPARTNRFFVYNEEKDDTVAARIKVLKTNKNVSYNCRRAFCKILDPVVLGQLP